MIEDRIVDERERELKNISRTDKVETDDIRIHVRIITTLFCINFWGSYLFINKLSTLCYYYSRKHELPFMLSNK